MSFRLFVIVGIPIIVALILMSIAFYLAFPQTCNEICPCVVQRKPIREQLILEVPVETIIDNQIHDVNQPPSYTEVSTI